MDKLKEKLFGLVVIVALGVIFIPMLFNDETEMTANLPRNLPPAPPAKAEAKMQKPPVLAQLSKPGDKPMEKSKKRELPADQEVQLAVNSAELVPTPSMKPQAKDTGMLEQAKQDSSQSKTRVNRTPSIASSLNPQTQSNTNQATYKIEQKQASMPENTAQLQAEQQKNLAKQRAEEEKRQAEQRAAEEKRLAQEQAAKERIEQEKRQAEQRAAEEKRLAQEQAAKERIEKEKRQAEQRAAEEKRLAQQRAIQEKNLAAQAEEKRLTEEKRQAEQRAIQEKRLAEQGAAKAQQLDAHRAANEEELVQQQGGATLVNQQAEEEKIAPVAASTQETSGQKKHPSTKAKPRNRPAKEAEVEEDEEDEEENEEIASAKSHKVAPVKGKQGNWSVQLGTFASEQNAKALVQKLRSAGYVVYTRKIYRQGQSLTVVSVRVRGEKSQATQVKDNLERRFHLQAILAPNG